MVGLCELDQRCFATMISALNPSHFRWFRHIRSGWIGMQGCQRRIPPAGGGVVLVDRLLWVSSGLLGSTDRQVEVLRWCHGGREGPNRTGSKESRRRTGLPAAASGCNSGRCWCRGRGWRPRELPGIEAKLLWGFAGARG